MFSKANKYAQGMLHVFIPNCTTKIMWLLTYNIHENIARYHIIITQRDKVFTNLPIMLKNLENILLIFGIPWVVFGDLRVIWDLRKSHRKSSNDLQLSLEGIGWTSVIFTIPQMIVGISWSFFLLTSKIIAICTEFPFFRTRNYLFSVSCFLETALLLTNQNWEFFSRILFIAVVLFNKQLVYQCLKDVSSSPQGRE